MHAGVCLEFFLKTDYRIFLSFRIKLVYNKSEKKDLVQILANWIQILGFGYFLQFES